MNKRGVTPLVATFLLIGFSIALGAIVMNWGKSYIEQQADFVKEKVDAGIVLGDACAQVEAKILRIGAEPQICMSGNILRVLVQNGVKRPIQNFHARLLDHMGAVMTVKNTLKQPLDIADAERIEVDITNNLQDVRQAYLIPIISDNGHTTYCEEESVVYEGVVPEC